MWRDNENARGFTLLEVIISLVIMGFIAISIGSGLVYSVQLFQTSKAADVTMPQLDAAFHVIRRTIQDGNKELLSCSDEKLYLKSGTGDSGESATKTVLLANVTSFDASSAESAFADSNAQVVHVKLQLNFVEDPIEFYVYEND